MKNLIKETIAILGAFACVCIYASIVSAISWFMNQFLTLLFIVLIPGSAYIGFMLVIYVENFCASKLSSSFSNLTRNLLFLIAVVYPVLNVWNVYKVATYMDYEVFFY